MIVIDIPAHMKCMEEGCKKTQPIELCLLATGNLGFKPPDATWQVLLSPQQIGGPYFAKCPEHRKSVVEVHRQIGPAGPRARVGH